MEEHPPKRRKLEQMTGLSAKEHDRLSSRGRAGSLGDRRDTQDMPKLVLPAPAHRHRAQHLQRSPETSREKVTKIHARQLLPAQVDNVHQAPAGSASTVLAVAIVDGQGNVSEMDVPMESGSVRIPGYGDLDVSNGATHPTVTASPISPSDDKYNAAAVTPPPAIAASQARAQALQSQEALAAQMNVVPQAPPSVPSPSPTSAAALQSAIASASSDVEVSRNSGTGQGSMSIAGPESNSQQVLSSPSTPSPATPQPSVGSSTSYFSSSPASPPNYASSYTTGAPSSQIPSVYNSQSLATNNSSMSALSSSSLTATASPASLSMTDSSSIESASASSASSQSAASQASVSSVAALTTLATAKRNSSSSATSTQSSQSLTSASYSSQMTITSAALTSSATSSVRLSSDSASAISLTSAASSTGIGAGGIGGSNTLGTAPSPTSTANNDSGGSSTPPTPVLVGGIVGGVAGAAMILIVLLLLLRWRRGKTNRRRNISPPIAQNLELGSVPQSGTMTQRSSSTPIAAAGFFSRLRPTSAQTATTADTAPSERGFQKISGRKLPSVLASGGDGYGGAGAGAASGTPAALAAAGIAPRAAGSVDATAGSSTWATASSSAEPPRPANKGGTVPTNQNPPTALAPGLRPSTPHSLSGSSFYRDSQGFYGGVVTHDSTQDDNDVSSSPSNSPSYPTPLNVAGIGSSSNRLPHNRPGPARTPVINEPATIPIRTPSRARQQAPRRAQGTSSPQNPSRDGLGRSRPSQDGSRGSRFREDTTPP